MSIYCKYCTLKAKKETSEDVNKNWETFKSAFGPYQITPNTKDITKCFHPEGKIGYQGMWAMPAWQQAVKQNADTFKPLSKPTDKKQFSGAMIVFSTEVNSSAKITECTKKYDKYYLHKGFEGKLIYGEKVFDKNSLTLEIAGIGTQEIIDLAQILADTFSVILTKDFNCNKVYLTVGKNK